MVYSGKTAGPICTKFSEKVWTDHGTMHLITFWVISEKPRDAATLISLSATLRENGLFWQNGWTDLHEIFREAVEWPHYILGQFGETARCRVTNFFVSNITRKRLHRFAWMHHSFCTIVCYRAVRSAILATAGLLVQFCCLPSFQCSIMLVTTFHLIHNFVPPQTADADQSTFTDSGTVFCDSHTYCFVLFH